MRLKTAMTRVDEQVALGSPAAIALLSPFPRKMLRTTGPFEGEDPEPRIPETQTTGRYRMLVLYFEDVESLGATRVRLYQDEGRTQPVTPWSSFAVPETAEGGDRAVVFLEGDFPVTLWGQAVASKNLYAEVETAGGSATLTRAVFTVES